MGTDRLGGRRTKNLPWFACHPLPLPSQPQKMILTDKKILEAMAAGEIVIEPFDRHHLGTNSYDVHLGKWLAVYTNSVLDARQHNPIEYLEIPDDGFVLQPGQLYLGVTKSIRKRMPRFPSSKGSPVWGAWGLTSMPRREKGMSASAIPGHWRSRARFRFGYITGCRSANSSTSRWRERLRTIITASPTPSTTNAPTSRGVDDVEEPFLIPSWSYGESLPDIVCPAIGRPAFQFSALLLYQAMDAMAGAHGPDP